MQLQFLPRLIVHYICIGYSDVIWVLFCKAMAFDDNKMRESAKKSPMFSMDASPVHTFPDTVKYMISHIVIYCQRLLLCTNGCYCVPTAVKYYKRLLQLYFLRMLWVTIVTTDTVPSFVIYREECILPVHMMVCFLFSG